MKIREYQAGGMFTTYQPILDVPTQSAAGVSSGTPVSGNSESKEDILSKDLMKELVGKGLPNEVNDWAVSMDKLSHNNGFMLPYNRQSSYRLIAKMNELEYNKTSLDKAVEEASKTDGLQELAVNQNGGVYVKDKSSNRLTVVSSDTLAKNADKYYAVTNAELLEMRKYDPDMVGRNDLTTTIQNSVGSNTITKQLMEVVKHIGSDTYKNNTYQGKKDIEEQLSLITGKEFKSASPEQQQAISDLHNLINATGDKEGLFDVTTVKKQMGDVRAKEAFNYLWNLLPNNSRNVLIARSASRGGSINDVESLIMQTINFTNSTEFEKHTEFKDGKSAAEKNRIPTQFESQLGRDIHNTKFKFNVGGHDEITVSGTILPGLVDKHNNKINSGTLSDILKTDFGLLVDKKSIYFGDKRVVNGNEVVYNDYGNSVNTFLPSVKDPSTGEYHPDFDLLETYGKTMDKILPGMNKVEADNILHQSGLDYLEYDPITKQVRARAGMSEYYQPYLISDGFTSSNAEEGTDNLLTRDADGSEVNQFRSKFVDNEVKNGKKTSSDTYISHWYNWGNSMKAGKIYMHLAEGAQQIAANITGGGSSVNRTTHEEEMARNAQNNSNLAVETAQWFK